ncbi:hypothetical protein PPL_00780 [Heterostelium album PN500]|uniref:EGF-like domain-containing protein n=1 Tax=Heterostelium pallidum (strain ATCC 26659 / Pp 5 / PN500) TaxID=670386 RepID=D3AXE9_HETP5|nr:hypothetical protein PPL_00780 [Heterostelium album PN500]EFA86218.1 hypothetical protein PPL_00780 [Heterostelium album PN500]|eukprot:XP_020438323.1 hypothetical protein PPL_00780 [Heterostelium album PN500]
MFPIFIIFLCLILGVNSQCNPGYIVDGRTCRIQYSNYTQLQVYTCVTAQLVKPVIYLEPTTILSCLNETGPGISSNILSPVPTIFYSILCVNGSGIPYLMLSDTSKTASCRDNDKNTTTSTINMYEPLSTNYIYTQISVCKNSINGKRTMAIEQVLGPNSASMMCLSTNSPGRVEASESFKTDKDYQVTQCPICSVNGTCSKYTRQCDCKSGYTNVTCDTDIDECVVNKPCSRIATCVNLPGSYVCQCPPGYTPNGSNGCNAINYCNYENNTCATGSGVDCTDNRNGTYYCQCYRGYVRINDTVCEPAMTLFSVTQIGKQRINITSDRFGGDANRVFVMYESGSRVRYCTNITITEPNVSLQCSTGPYQVSGFWEVWLDYDKVSNELRYPLPFITKIGAPPTQGGLVIVNGVNLPKFPRLILGDILVTLSNTNSNQVRFIAPPGTGVRTLRLFNDTIENTDTLLFKYAAPNITQTNSILETGGKVFINGTNFGDDPSVITVQIGPSICKNITMLQPHTQISCDIGATPPISYLLQMNVSTVPANKFYFTTLPLPTVEFCSNNTCSNRGSCVNSSCICETGYIGSRCEQESSPIIILPGDGGEITVTVDKNTNFTISIVSVSEMDLDTVADGYNLTGAKWNLENDVANRWDFYLTLPNNATINSTFQYFINDTDVQFGDQLLHMAEKTLKLSISIALWPFASRVNTLRVVIKSNMLSESLNPNGCTGKSVGTGSNNSTTTDSTKNQYQWTTLSGQDNGMIARIVNQAIVDGRSIVANIQEQLANDFIEYSMSVPYFEESVLFDPDYSVFLKVKDNSDDQCNQSTAKDDNLWKIVTGSVR